MNGNASPMKSIHTECDAHMAFIYRKSKWKKGDVYEEV